MGKALIVSRDKWYERIGFVPHYWQAKADRLLDSGVVRFLAAFAFPQAGKSFWAAKHLEPALLRPDFHCWLVAPTYTLGSKEFGYMYQDFANAGVLKLAKAKHFDPRGGNMQIEFPWGSFVRVVSADNPDSLRMEQLDAIILCEASALPSNVYERFLYSRVELRKGRVIVPTTPAGFNWVYEAFRVPSLRTLEFTYGEWEGLERKRVGGRINPKYDPLYHSMIISAVADFGEVLAPGVHTPEAVERARRVLPRPAFAEQFGGDFASFAGLIYQFDPAEHEEEPFVVPEDWTHVVGWDHGADNPTAILFGSYDYDGVLHWWDEVYVAGASAKTYVQMLRGKLGMKAPSAIVIDPSAKQMRIELLHLGVTTTTPYDKQIEARISRVQEAMRTGKWKVMRGRCPNLVQEMQAWEWDEKDTHKPRAKQRCHALDAMGYAMLVPVPMPQTKNALDPDEVPGETAAQSFVWKSWRRKMREDEQAEEREQRESVLDMNPFAEVGSRAQEYDFAPGEMW